MRVFGGGGGPASSSAVVFFSAGDSPAQGAPQGHLWGTAVECDAAISAKSTGAQFQCGRRFGGVAADALDGEGPVLGGELRSG